MCQHTMKPSPWAINCRRSGGVQIWIFWKRGTLLTKPLLWRDLEIFFGDKAGGSGGGGMIG